MSGVLPVLRDVCSHPWRYLLVADPGLYLTRTVWQGITGVGTLVLVGWLVALSGVFPGFSENAGIMAASAYAITTALSLRTYKRRELGRRAVVMFFATGAAAAIATAVAPWPLLAAGAYVLAAAVPLWMPRYGPLGDIAGNSVMNGFLLTLIGAAASPDPWTTYLHGQVTGLLAVTVMVLVRWILASSSTRRHLRLTRHSLTANRRIFCRYAALLLAQDDRVSRAMFTWSRAAMHRTALVLEAVLAVHPDLPFHWGERFQRLVFDLDLRVAAVAPVIERLATGLRTVPAPDPAYPGTADIRAAAVKLFAHIADDQTAQGKHVHADLAALRAAIEAAERDEGFAIRGPQITSQDKHQLASSDGAAQAAPSGHDGAGQVACGPAVAALGEPGQTLSGRAPSERAREDTRTGAIPLAPDAQPQGDAYIVPGAHRLVTLTRDLSGAVARCRVMSDMLDTVGPARGTGYSTGIPYANFRPLGKAALATAAARKTHLGRLVLDMDVRNLIQGLIAMSIASMLGYLIEPHKFYWATIGAFIMMKGASVTADRFRKVARRLIGTAIGGGVGILIAVPLSQAHPAAQVLIAVGALAIGAGLLTISYTWFVVFLTITLVEVYLSGAHGSTGTVDLLVLYRIIENGTGAIIGAVVATFVLPLHSRAALGEGISRVSREVTRLLHDVRRIVMGESGARPGIDARLVGIAVDQMDDVASALIKTPRNARRLDGTRALIAALRGIAVNAGNVAQAITAVEESGMYRTMQRGDTASTDQAAASQEMADQQRPDQEAGGQQIPHQQQVNQNQPVGISVDLRDRLVAIIEDMADRAEVLAQAYADSGRPHDDRPAWVGHAPALDQIGRELSEVRSRSAAKVKVLVAELIRLDDAMASAARRASR